MIKTESGRLSRTQALNIIMAAIYSVNAPVLQAFGLDAEKSLAVVSVLGVFHAALAAYLRTKTSEPM